MPTPSTWVKTTPFGDYKDPKQNGKSHEIMTEQYHLVRNARKSNRRHPGSKCIHTLRMYK